MKSFLLIVFYACCWSEDPTRVLHGGSAFHFIDKFIAPTGEDVEVMKLLGFIPHHSHSPLVAVVMPLLG